MIPAAIMPSLSCFCLCASSLAALLALLLLVDDDDNDEDAFEGDDVDTAPLLVLPVYADTGF